MTRLHALASTSSTSETELLKVLELQPAAVTEVDDRGYNSADRSGVLPLHILCRYHAREETSVKRMLAAFPDAVQHSDHRGV